MAKKKTSKKVATIAGRVMEECQSLRALKESNGPEVKYYSIKIEDAMSMAGSILSQVEAEQATSA